MRYTKSTWLPLFFALGLVGVARTAEATPTPVVDYYEASRSTIDTLQAVRLSWKVRDAVRVDIYDGFRHVIIPDLGSENFIEVWPERTSEYRLLAYGANGEVTTAALTITFAPLSIELFQAATPRVWVPQNVRVWWNVRGATRVELIDGARNITVGTFTNQGSVDVWVERTTMLSLIAYGPDNQVTSAQLEIVVNRQDIAVIQFFRADTQVLQGPRLVRLSFVVEGAARVEIRDGLTGMVYQNLAPRGQIEVLPRATTTYTLTAWGQNGQVVSRDLTVTVEQPNPACR